MEGKVKRLLKYLAHIRKFPTSLRAASIVSGLSEKQVSEFLQGISKHTYLFPMDGLIYRKIDSNNESTFSKVI